MRCQVLGSGLDVGDAAAMTLASLVFAETCEEGQDAEEFSRDVACQLYSNYACPAIQLAG